MPAYRDSAICSIILGGLQVKIEWIVERHEFLLDRSPGVFSSLRAFNSSSRLSRAAIAYALSGPATWFMNTVVAWNRRSARSIWSGILASRRIFTAHGSCGSLSRPCFVLPPELMNVMPRKTPMTQYPYILFNKSPEQLRRQGARGGKAYSHFRDHVIAAPLKRRIGREGERSRDISAIT
jgi:hypothetical protein